LNINFCVMKNGSMTIAHIGQGKDTLMKVPAAPGHLCVMGKRGYKMMGNYLAQAERLKSYYLPTLEIWAAAYAQWQYAMNEINTLNKIEPGKGFIQKFGSGARNLSPEVTLKNDAADTMMKCAKLFGLDPKSEKELKASIDSGQLDMFKNYADAK
jgi:P27 family predicted phage terminase small subunit